MIAAPTAAVMATGAFNRQFGAMASQIVPSTTAPIRAGPCPDRVGGAGKGAQSGMRDQPQVDRKRCLRAVGISA